MVTDMKQSRGIKFTTQSTSNQTNLRPIRKGGDTPGAISIFEFVAIHRDTNQSKGEHP